MGDSEGEKSMDLVTTPMEESSISLHNTRPEAPESSYIDPPHIPLPPSPSPSHLRSSSSSLPHGLHSDLPLPTSALKEEKIQKLKDELEEARRDLEEKELALDELRNIVGGLQLQAQVRLSDHNEDVGQGSVEDTGNLFPLHDALY